MAAMLEPAGVDPTYDVTPDFTPDVLARLAAFASQRAFLAFIPQQERVPA
jgi:hypothetical protein